MDPDPTRFNKASNFAWDCDLNNKSMRLSSHSADGVNDGGGRWGVDKRSRILMARGVWKSDLLLCPWKVDATLWHSHKYCYKNRDKF